MNPTSDSNGKAYVIHPNDFVFEHLCVRCLKIKKVEQIHGFTHIHV